MKIVNKYFDKSNKGFVLIMIVVLLCLFGYSVSSFLAEVPSEGFSRELEIAQVEAGKQININSHVETIIVSDEKAMIAAVDGHEFRLITISNVGEILEDQVVDLDLFYATEVSSFINNDGNLVVIYNKVDLFEATIDLNTLSYTTTEIAKEVSSFTREEDVIVFQQETGLYSVTITDYDRVLPLVHGEIKSFRLEKDHNANIYHLLTTIKNIINVDITYIQFGEDLRVVNDFVIRENTGSNRLKYISAIDVGDELLTAVYVWSDNKFGSNNVTVQQYKLTTGEMTTNYYDEFSFHHSKYVITNVVGSQVSMLFQDDVHYGVNIVEAIMEEDVEPLITPLTKTKKLSYLSKYFTIGDDQAIVFVDLVNRDKMIYFASSNEMVIEETTKATSIDPIRIIGLIFIVIFQAAFTGAVVYLLFVAIGPFILLLIMNKFLPKFKNQIYIQSFISVMIHTGLKLRLTYQLIHEMQTYVFVPPIIGAEPYIYVVMVVLSIISYLLMSRYIKWNIEYTSTAMTGYLHFIFFEYVSYTLLVYIYITTYLVINKI